MRPAIKNFYLCFKKRKKLFIIVLTSVVLIISLVAIGNKLLFNMNEYNFKAQNEITSLWNYTDSDVFSTPILGDVNNDGKLEVVVSDYTGEIYVLNGETGNKIWSYFTSSDYTIYTPALGDVDNDGDLDVVAVSNSGIVYALDGSNGNLIWRFNTTVFVYTSPALADFNNDSYVDVVIGSENGTIFALNGRTGAILWKQNVNVWVLSVGLGDVNNDKIPDIIIGGTSFIGSLGGVSNGAVYVLDGKTGNKIWEYKDVLAVSVVAFDDINNDGSLEAVVGAWNGLFVFEGESGNLIWKNDSISSIVSLTVGDVTGDEFPDVLVLCVEVSSQSNIATNAVLVAVNGTNGCTIWSYSLSYDYYYPLRRGTIVLGDVNFDNNPDVLVGGNNTIYALSGVKGDLLWTYIRESGFLELALGDVDNDNQIELVATAHKNEVFALDISV